MVVNIRDQGLDKPPEDQSLFDGDPIPLTHPVNIPSFPVDALPGPIADMVAAVSSFTQTDSAMAGTVALSVLSTCNGGHAEIQIREGWREPLNTYTAPIAESGERKSAVQRLMVDPIVSVERRLAEAGAGTRAEALARKRVATKAAEREANTAAAAEPDRRDEALADAIGAAAFADAITVPVIPRLVADDITPEAAESLLAEQGGRLAIVSAEGGIFDIVAGRYSGNVPNLDVWLKGHSGDQVRVDRKGREPEYIAKPAVTLGVMLQPEVLRRIAANPVFRGRGLLARVLYAFPESKVGRREISPDPIDTDVLARYRGAVEDLAAGMYGWGGDPAVLMLTSAAHDAVLALEQAVEPTLAGDGELGRHRGLREWGSKYVGAVARIAGNIHLGALGPEDGPRTPVADATIEQATRIGEYYKACAMRAFTEMGTDPAIADAAYLLGRIVKVCADQGTDQVSERDLFTACSRSRFRTKADMLPACKLLADHGYLALQQKAQQTGGRPSSPVFAIHPLAAKAAIHAEGRS